MNQLKERIEALYPMPVKPDVLEEIKIGRLRSAFREGLYFMLSEILKMVPEEDKSKPDAWNDAWVEVMDKYEVLANGIHEHYRKEHEEIMAAYDKQCEQKTL